MGRLLLPEITEQLIEARGNLDLQHENVATPLTIAANRGQVAVAQLLLAEDGKQWSRPSLPLCREGAREYLPASFHNRSLCYGARVPGGAFLSLILALSPGMRRRPFWMDALA